MQHDNTSGEGSLFIKTHCYNNIELHVEGEKGKLQNFSLVKDGKTYSAILPDDEEVAKYYDWLTLNKHYGTTPRRKGHRANYVLINLGYWCEVRFPQDFDSKSIFRNPSSIGHQAITLQDAMPSENKDVKQASSKVKNLICVSSKQSDLIREYTDEVQNLQQRNDQWPCPNNPSGRTQKSVSKKFPQNASIVRKRKRSNAECDEQTKRFEVKRETSADKGDKEEMTDDSASVIRDHMVGSGKQNYTKWIKQEEKVLLKGGKKAQPPSHPDWGVVSKSVSNIEPVFRSGIACHFKYRRMRKSKPKQARRKRRNVSWTEEELISLETEVAKYHKMSSIAWKAISKSVSIIHSVHRSAQACRQMHRKIVVEREAEKHAKKLKSSQGNDGTSHNIIQFVKEAISAVLGMFSPNRTNRENSG